MIFEWKIEDNKFNNERKAHKSNYRDTHIYDIEHKLSKDEKRQYIDELSNNALSYVISLFEKYENEQDCLALDKWGYPKTNSLQAWIRRNDPRHILKLDKSKTGEINIRIPNEMMYRQSWDFPHRKIMNMNTRGIYDTYADYIEETFHKLIVAYSYAEQKYFTEHDTYTLLSKDAQHYIEKFGTFGSNIGISSCDGLIIENEHDKSYRRKLTEEELKIFIEKGKQVEKFIENLSENPITY